MKKRATKNGTSFQGKIKTEHAIVQGLYATLQVLTEIKEIHSIIPGKIMRRGSSTPFPVFNLTIRTSSGWKAVGKSKGSTQDFFIVTKDPETVKTKIQRLLF